VVAPNNYHSPRTIHPGPHTPGRGTRQRDQAEGPGRGRQRNPARLRAESAVADMLLFTDGT